MSVHDLFAFQASLEDWVRQPRAWLLRANPVWGSHETMNRIALFDTLELAQAYLEASRLPEVDNPEIHTTKDGYRRSFRPDSLLWDYNYESRRHLVPAVPWMRYEDVRVNPPAPAGPIENGPKEWSPRGIGNLGEYNTRLPQFGRDYDQGFGGQRTNMDAELPFPPPAGPLA